MRRSPLVVNEVAVPLTGLDPVWPGLRIAHISDFHFRRWNRTVEAARDALLVTDYDFLVFTGDIGNMIRFWRRSARLAKRFFEPLVDRAPMYAVLGNHDNPAMPQEGDLPLRFLRNESIELTHDGVVFELAGVEQTEYRREGDLDAALRRPPSKTFTILLAHYPSTVFRLPPDRVDLLLCGHTHGGQIRLPRFGCLWPNDRIPRQLARGLHRVGNTFLHVTPGLGVSPPIPLRLHCPPEVSILTVSALDTSRETYRPFCTSPIAAL